MVPESLRYMPTHEWCAPAEGMVTIGVTEYATGSLGEIVCVDLPGKGDDVLCEVPFGELTGTDGTMDLRAPVDGTVAAVNEGAVHNPELVTGAPYGEGWLIRLRPLKEMNLDHLLSAEEYEQTAKKRR